MGRNEMSVGENRHSSDLYTEMYNAAFMDVPELLFVGRNVSVVRTGKTCVRRRRKHFFFAYSIHYSVL